MTIETENTTEPEHLTPLQGNPGFQEHQTCNDCGGHLKVKEVIWESESSKRVSLRCEECGDITVSTKENRMFRNRIEITRDE